MRNETRPRVIDRQLIASRAELEVERGELAITNLNIVDAAVRVHGKLLATNRLKVDLVGVAARVDVNSLLDVDIGQRQIGRTGTVENSQAALNGHVFHSQLIHAATEANGCVAANDDGESGRRRGAAGREFRVEIDMIVAIACVDVECEASGGICDGEVVVTCTKIDIDARPNGQ